MPDPDDLAPRLRALLAAQAQVGVPVSYCQAADRLGLVPPGVIGRIGAALEALMEEDAAAGRPLLAALCLSRTGSGLPARGFFDKAAALGLFAGDPAGPAARAFHAGELVRLQAAYRG